MTFKIGDLVRGAPSMFSGNTREMVLYVDKGATKRIVGFVAILTTTIGEVVGHYGSSNEYPVVWWPQLNGYNMWHQSNLILATNR